MIMKVIIAGSRSIFPSTEAIGIFVRESGFEITEVVSGKAPGVDSRGESWAKKTGIPVKLFRAEWVKFGRSAGPIRNSQMALYADALIAIMPYRKTAGTADMIRQMDRLGKPVYPVIWKKSIAREIAIETVVAETKIVSQQSFWQAE